MVINFTFDEKKLFTSFQILFPKQNKTQSKISAISIQCKVVRNWKIFAKGVTKSVVRKIPIFLIFFRFEWLQSIKVLKTDIFEIRKLIKKLSLPEITETSKDWLVLTIERSVYHLLLENKTLLSSTERSNLFWICLSNERIE